MNAAFEPPHPTRWRRAQSLIGQGVAAIDTPALVIDLDAMERNLAHMAAYARAHGLRLRPHAKMHKSAELARLQMAHGAVGVCVQKTDEALALAHAGVTDVYISNEVIALPKLQRLAEAVRDLPTRFGIAIDSAAGVLRAAHPGVPLPSLGDTVWLVPGHCDPTVNLHDVMVGVRGGLVSGQVERLIRVDARGAVG